VAYVQCPQCGLICFSVAYWSSVEYCGRCGAELPHPSRGGASPPRPRSRAAGEAPRHPGAGGDAATVNRDEGAPDT
jgi:hypothetical protein